MDALLDSIPELPQQFDPKVTGRVLILDGDSLAYRCATTSKRLKTAIRKFQLMVLEQMFICKAESARVHLTAADSDKTGRGRIKGFKPYQENRSNSTRPPMLEELREAVSSSEHSIPEYTCFLHNILEADDACMVDSYWLGRDGILYSEDKDLRQTPYTLFDPYLSKEITPEGVGSVWMHETPAGNYDIHGCGRLFFWAQMLRGDVADNIRGLDKYDGRNIGPVATLELLEPYNGTEDESDVANLVLGLYKEIDQNPLPEGYLLHMMRDYGDSFLEVLESLCIDPDLKHWLYHDCMRRHWFDTSE